MLYRFGTFEFDSDNGELRKNGRAVALEPQPAKALALLLSRRRRDRHPRRAARRGLGRGHARRFRSRPGVLLSQVRTALGDSGDNPRFVQTIPKRGFKFIAPVSRCAASPPHRLRRVLPTPPMQPPAGPQWCVVSCCVVAGRTRWRSWSSLFGARRYPIAPLVQAGVRSACRSSTTKPGSPNTIGSSPACPISSSSADRSSIPSASPSSATPHVAAAAAQHPQPEGARGQCARADYVLLGQLQQGESGLALHHAFHPAARRGAPEGQSPDDARRRRRRASRPRWSRNSSARSANTSCNRPAN